MLHNNINTVKHTFTTYGLCVSEEEIGAQWNTLSGGSLRTS